MRVWRCSCHPKIFIRDLIEMYRSLLDRRMDVVWIWRVIVQPTVRLFLWKVAWDRLPTSSLLKGKGMDISISCPAYGLKDKIIKHAILNL